MITDDAPALRNIQDPNMRIYRQALEIGRDAAIWMRTRGHTARGALVLGYVAPLHLRKPRMGERAPDGWVRTVITSHLLPECLGTWWVPREALHFDPRTGRDARCGVTRLCAENGWLEI